MAKLLLHYLYVKHLFLYGSLGWIYNNLLIPIQRHYCKHKRYRPIFGLLGFIIQLIHTILLELLCNERSADYFPQIRYPQAKNPFRHKDTIYERYFTLELSFAFYGTIYYFMIQK